jgi:PEP-CTERM motif
MKCKAILLFAGLVLAISASPGSLVAAPAMDGTADGEYGAALSVQNTNTQFGNADSGDPINAGGGSEIDQIFGTVADGRLYVTIAGNLESNFNKLEVFIDTDGAAGGVNQTDTSSLPAEIDPYSGGAMEGMDFLIFDNGFYADHYLTFTHGFEKVRPDTSEQLEFWALSAHYADLTDGTNGTVAALGMQVGQRGLPNVLRGTTADFDTDGTVDGGEFLTWQRNNGATGASRSDGDATGDGNVNGDDLQTWQAKYGFDVATATFDEDHFAPMSAGTDNSDALLGPALPGLAQGELIDKNYALGSGGCNADNSGADCLTRELEFVLPIDLLNDPNNSFSHRDMENVVDLQMALDNSNVAGVSGDAGANEYSDPTTEDPTVVTTGIEFSIPLSEIGNPAGDISIVAFVNGSGHNWSSNQYAGQGILAPNPGSLMPDLDIEYDGDQFVTIGQEVPGVESVPEPASALMLLVGAAACGLLCRRS